MDKKFITKVVLATALMGGVNFLPMQNFDVGKVHISVAYAESKNFAAKEAAMTDVEYIEAQAKEASRMRAIEAVKEKIASYVRNFSGVKGKLSEDDIIAIAEKFEEVGTAKYKKLFYNAVDENGKELGKVGIMYEATVTAKFNSKKITEYIKLTEQEKERRIRQARESREKFEELDREYEELRKNARTKTPEQMKSEIKKFDDKLSDLDKRKGKNKPVKKDKPTTQQDKIQPMRFSNPVEIGLFGYGERFSGTLIKGASYANETPRYVNDHGMVYSKGIARFGEINDAIYLHYGNGNFKIGSEDLKNTISYDYGYGATIFKVNATNGYTMYFLKKLYDAPSPRYFYILIGRRPDGKWVKYFDTEDLSKQYLGNSKNISIQKVTSNGDTIIVSYARCNRLPKEMGGYFYEKFADEFGEFRFKWDEAAKWFGVEKITYNQNNSTPQKTTENKPVTNQPLKMSQPVEIGGIGIPYQSQISGLIVKGASYNDGTPHPEVEKYSRVAGIKIDYTYTKGTARWGDGADALYCDYTSGIKFGGKNNYVMTNPEGHSSRYQTIFKIGTNVGITLYYMWLDSDAHYFNIIGRQKDGKWVSYIDCEKIAQTYFGGHIAYKKNGGVHYLKPKFEGDTITVEYEFYTSNFEFKMIGRGEFRFKWDEAAQWFSVEQVKY